MDEAKKLSLEQIQAFLEASEEVRFKGANRRELYDWVEQDAACSRICSAEAERQGSGAAYIAKMTGLSRAQVTRLIGQYRAGGTVKARAYRRIVSRSATRRPTSRCWRGGRGARNPERAGHAEDSVPGVSRVRQAGLRASGGDLGGAYLQLAQAPRPTASAGWTITKTRPTPVAIGERRKPEPQDGPAICAWTRCIRAIWMESRAFITSTRWTK